MNVIDQCHIAAGRLYHKGSNQDGKETQALIIHSQTGDNYSESKGDEINLLGFFLLTKSINRGVFGV